MFSGIPVVNLLFPITRIRLFSPISLLGRSAYGLTPTPSFTHSLSALEMLRISLSGPPNRRKQPGRYVQYAPKFSENFLQNIDKNIYMIYKYG
jgi:hypothetical protein